MSRPLEVKDLNREQIKAVQAFAEELRGIAILGVVGGVIEEDMKSWIDVRAEALTLWLLRSRSINKTMLNILVDLEALRRSNPDTIPDR
jgi:hypothetical protein